MSLTSSQLKKIEARLLEERARLIAQLNEFTNAESAEDSQEQAGNLSKLPFHQADLGTDTANEELEASIATRRSAEIGEIDAALERLRTSPEKFGLDENTGESIPFERLDIIPWARTAVHH
jgi:RNA polymerase-binding transcription factor DksA